MELALRLAELLEQHPEELPAPPVSAAELRAAVAAFTAARAAADAAEAALPAHHAAREQALVSVKNALSTQLRFANVDVRGRPERLSGLGWGGRPGATDREPPGEVRDLAVQAVADSSVALEWRPPLDGGPAAAYTVQRRKPGGRWEEVATAVGNECLLSDQPRGVEFNLRVAAVNSAGAGPASGTVTVVL